MALLASVNESLCFQTTTFSQRGAGVVRHTDFYQKGSNGESLIKRRVFRNDFDPFEMQDFSQEERTNEENNGKDQPMLALLRYVADTSNWRIPPFRVDDPALLFYDVFLLLNLSLSISFHVVHRMSVDVIHVVPAISEGSLLCILWVLAGWFRGAFAYSAVDGNRDLTQEEGGPKAAGLLGLQTFIDTSSLRVCIALVQAISEHRRVGSIPGEDLMLLEITFGLALMSVWRLLHSTYTPR